MAPITPRDNTDPDEEYWTDSSMDRLFDDILHIQESGGQSEMSIPPQTPHSGTMDSNPGMRQTSHASQSAGNFKSQNGNGPGYSIVTTTEHPARQPNPQRLYPRIDTDDILLSARRSPHAAVKTHLEYNGPTVACTPNRTPCTSIHEDTASDSDSDDDHFSSPISLSPEGSVAASNQAAPTPANRNTTRSFAASSRLSSPFNILSSTQGSNAPSSTWDARHSQSTASGDSTRSRTPSSAHISPTHGISRQGGHAQPLDRAATMPTLFTSEEDPFVTGMPRSMSMGTNCSQPQNTRPNSTSNASYFSLTQNPDGIVVVAHNRIVQEKMDHYGISWGAQYEIARGVCNSWWTWEEVSEAVLRGLQGKNNQHGAPTVYQMMMKQKGQSLHAAAQNYLLWMELDREQDAIVEHADRGLGLMGEWGGEKDWYGGRIQQIVRLVKNSEGRENRWSLKLESMRIGRSHRFARYLGSRRVLLVKYHDKDVSSSKDCDMDALKMWFNQRFVLCGRVFVPFAVKEEKVYMCEVDEDYERDPKASDGDQWRLSLQELVEWHNPLTLNRGQAVSKWTARFDLGLSTSVPVLQFAPENICLIDDEYVHGYPEPGKKAPAHTIFTDGCGYMNGAALMAIGQQVGYRQRPTAVQGRFLGSKGVWMLHPEDQLPIEPPRIWVRQSQLKIHHIPQDDWTPGKLRALHRAHLIFDLLAPPRLTLPSRLNRLAILNLDYNGVSEAILVKLMEDGLREEVNALRQWKGQGAMELLWRAVDRAAGVTTQRLQRIAAGRQRALGIVRREEDDYGAKRELNEDGGEDQAQQDAGEAGKPASVGETVIEKLQSGFSPLQDWSLCDDMKRIIKNTLESYIAEYHITVPSSVEAFIVPDPHGVLEPDEIHLKTSDSEQCLMDPLKHLNPQTLQGDVLIYRNPARLPSDIQKVHAVDHPALAEYKDVIVLPIKGERSLASLLAGGDVDGDTAVCIFDERIVNEFRTPPRTGEVDLTAFFEPLGTICKVDKVIEDMEHSPSHEDSARTLRSHLLQGLREISVGLYSKFHENSIYEHGYDHYDTIRIGSMFNEILDSRKSGLRIRQSVFRSDKLKHEKAAPVCLGGPVDPGNSLRTGRIGLPQFILENLLEKGQAIRDKILSEYGEDIKHLSPYSLDADLLGPYQKARKLPILEAEISRVEAHVDKCLDEWRSIIWDRSEERNKKRSRRTENNNAKAQKILKLYKEVLTGVDTLVQLDCLDRLKASYAHYKNPKFAWRMAHTELCKIKADACNSRPLTKSFADLVTVPNAVNKIYGKPIASSYTRR